MVEKAVVLLASGCEDSGISKPLSVCLFLLFLLWCWNFRRGSWGLTVLRKRFSCPVLGHRSFLKWSVWPGKGGVGPWSGPACPEDHHQGKGKWVVFLETLPKSCGWREKDRVGWLLPKAIRQSRRTDWRHFLLPFGSEPKQSTLPGVTWLWHQVLPPSPLPLSRKWLVPPGCLCEF